MENQKKNVLSNWDFFVWNWEKNLFGIGNAAKFQPQIWVMESPERVWQQMSFSCRSRGHEFDPFLFPYFRGD